MVIEKNAMDVFLWMFTSCYSHGKAGMGWQLLHFMHISVSPSILTSSSRKAEHFHAYYVSCPWIYDRCSVCNWKSFQHAVNIDSWLPVLRHSSDLLSVCLPTVAWFLFPWSIGFHPSFYSEVWGLIAILLKATIHDIVGINASGAKSFRLDTEVITLDTIRSHL